MPNNTLNDFIKHARDKGMDHATIRMLLLSSGWREKDIARAMSSESLDMPVPVPPDAGSARDAFLHLLNFACLYTTLIGAIVLLFTYIERWLPDAATEGASLSMSDEQLSTIRWWLAALIVVFPLFLWLSRKLLSEMAAVPEKARSGVRRWLTYLTLFFAALALMGDGITLVFRLLEGELTLRFLLKVLVVFLTTGLTFTYYLFAVVRGGDRFADRAFHRAFAATAAAAVLCMLAWGLVQVGSPGTERLRKFDERRVEDLRAIEAEVFNIVYDGKQWQAPVPAAPSKPLPATLREVADLATLQRLTLADPQTGAPYEYLVKDATHFQLCAVFNAERKQQYDIQWDHPAGRHCYAFDVLRPQSPAVKLQE